MAILSIHIDESGNLNLTNRQNPEYCIAMVLHDQNDDIYSELSFLDEKLSNIGGSLSFVHSMPLIRQEWPYETMEGRDRKRIFNTFASFVSSIPVSYTMFVIDKTHFHNTEQMRAAFECQITQFIESHLEYFQRFEKIVCYYDRGQAFVTQILQNAFSAAFGGNVEFRKAYQKDYRLLQVADYICTLELSKLRWDENRETKSERGFFGTRQIFMKNYYRKIQKKHIGK